MSSPTTPTERARKWNKRKWAVANCSRKCSLNEINMPGGMAALIHSWYEEGFVDREIEEKSAAYGHRISQGASERHRRNHLIPADHLVELEGKAHRPTDPTALPERKVSDIDLLDAMIAKGAQTVHQSHVKITSEQLLRAIELKHKLTQGSAFADFFSAIGAAMEETMPTGDTPDAAASAEEQAQGDAPDGV